MSFSSEGTPDYNVEQSIHGQSSEKKPNLENETQNLPEILTSIPPETANYAGIVKDPNASTKCSDNEPTNSELEIITTEARSTEDHETSICSSEQCSIELTGKSDKSFSIDTSVSDNVCSEGNADSSMPFGSSSQNSPEKQAEDLVLLNLSSDPSLCQYREEEDLHQSSPDNQFYNVDSFVKYMKRETASEMPAYLDLTIPEHHISHKINKHNVAKYFSNNKTLSKSAENIPDNVSCISSENTCYSSGLSLNLYNEKIDKEKVLSEFDKKKPKLTMKVNEKLVPNETSIEGKFPRSHKDILTPDLAYIVKNVHGIFSSMSGSFKTYSQKTLSRPIAVKSVPASGVTQHEKFTIENNNPKCENISKSQTEVTPKHELVTRSIQNENEHIEGDVKNDLYKLQVESLEKLLAEQSKELNSLRERTKQQAEELHEKDNTFKDIEAKMELMRKRVERAEKEKDSAVMRYAVSERRAIEALSAAAAARAAEQRHCAEAELLATKVKGAHAEKQRICNMLDDKCHELSLCEKELAKTKEELVECQGRLKWTQNKWKMELESYKGSAEKAEKLSHLVAEMEATRESAVASAGDAARVKQLESELKEARAAVILCRHDRDELERRLASVSKQHDTCTHQLTEARTLLAAQDTKMKELAASNLRLEEEACELAALRVRAALADTLTAQLQRESERASRAEQEAGTERARAETCARREADALAHAARVTQAHVTERAQLHDAEAKARALSADNASLREKLSSLEIEITELRRSLAEEVNKRKKECQLLAQKVAEQTEECDKHRKELEWEKGENAVLKKKHASSIRELNRELQRALKRCGQLESKYASETQEDRSTRTGSVSSLSSYEGTPRAPPAEPKLTNGHASEVGYEIQMKEPDKQTLIERIVQLQRASARRAERCDFLEEHNRQLLAELRKQSRLLRHLLAAHPAGAVAAPHRDLHKKEMARLGGGAMAAVWGGPADGMTLELSVEMNRKLQAVLEDTLLKNITLKENMDTLGAEIARLKSQNDAKTS